MKKKNFLIILMFILLLSNFTTVNAAESEKGIMIEWANLRKGPSSKSEKIGKMFKDDPVNILSGKKGDYIKIYDPESKKSGYVLYSRVKKITKTKTAAKYGVAAKKLILRKKNDPKSTKIGTIFKYDKVRVLKSYSKMLKVYDPESGKTGFVEKNGIKTGNQLVLIAKAETQGSSVKTSLGGYTAKELTEFRAKNLAVASKKLGIQKIQAGKTWSWIKTMGVSGKAAGYYPCIVFSGGKSAIGYGGGVCQVATTIATALNKTKKISFIERHNHSKSTSYVKTGVTEAMVSAPGGKDLKIKNISKKVLYFKSKSSGQTVEVFVYMRAKDF